MRDSFVIYKSMIEAISLLSPEEGIEMIQAMGAFSFEEIEPSFEKPNMKMCWLLIRPLLEKNNKNYKNGCNGGAPKGNRNNPNGRRGKPITNRELTENQSTPSNDVDDNDDDDVDDNDDVDGEGDVDEKEKTNHTPTLEDIYLFVNKKGLSIDPEKFFNHYQAFGWKGVQDWESLALSWNLSEDKHNKDLSKAEIKSRMDNRNFYDDNKYYRAVYNWCRENGKENNNVKIWNLVIKYLRDNDFSFPKGSLKVKGSKIEPKDMPDLIKHLLSIQESGEKET